MSDQTPTDPAAEHTDLDSGPAPGVTQDDVDHRAELLPEEQAAGSEDPEGQARVILEESVERTEDPSGTRAESTQTQGTDG